MAKQRFLNNFTSIFIAAVKDAPSSGTPETELDYGVLRISDGAAGSLINPTDGDYYLLTAFKRSGSVESNIEVMRVTGVNNSTPGECRITVQRAQEGTSAKAFVAGDYLSLRITKGTAENFSQPSDLATKEPVIGAPVSSPTEKYWRGDKTWRDFFTDVRAATLTGLSTATNAVVAATDTVLDAIGKLQAQVSAKFDKTGGDIGGNINLTGTGRRITGDFSNTTLANRAMFQTSAANSPTTLGVLPSGTSDVAALAAYANSDPANTSSMRMLATSIDGRLDANRSGTGSYLPMTFHAGGAERLRIDPTTGNVLATSGALGYGIGAGGIATQGTTDPRGKGTPVTLNKPSGRITTHPAELAAGASVSWVCLNTYVQANCCVVVSGIYDGGAVYPANYQIDVAQVGTGYFEVRVKNITASALSDALPIQFVVNQGAVS